MQYWGYNELKKTLIKINFICLTFFNGYLEIFKLHVWLMLYSY